MTDQPDSTQYVLHVAGADDWRARSETHYEPTSYASEGFIHCCTREQLSGVLDRHYTGRQDLLLCTLDASLIGAPLVWENTSGGTELFPHIYGPISLAAVVRTEAIAGPADRRNAPGR